MGDGGIRVRRATDADWPACREIRARVFIEEQGVPEEIEYDGLDDGCVQLVACIGEAVVGTARLRIVDGVAKAERVAVDRDRRRGGIGQALMRGLEQQARDRGHDRIVLNAQLAAVPFYESLGYRAEGECFEEAGIPHRRMTRCLSDAMDATPATEAVSPPSR